MILDTSVLGKGLVDYTILFSPNEYKGHAKIMLKHFQKNLKTLR